VHALRLIYPVIVRYALRHKLIAALNVASIALGVSVYLAIQTANASANKAFEAGVDLVAGKSQLEVRSAAQGGVPETLLPQVTAFPSVKAATPIVEGYATLPEMPGEYLHIVGVDPFTNSEFRTSEARITSGGYQADLESWLARPRYLALSKTFCDRASLTQGDVFDLSVNGTTVKGIVGFLIEDENSQFSSRVAAMDIGWAQELLGTSGTLSSIQVVLDDPSNARAMTEALQATMPPEAMVSAPEQRSVQVQLMLQGFQLNLRALSMVSLLVGVFLIYNTVSASVVRRRKEIGTLRSLGATPAQIQALFLLEAAVVGLLGVFLGVAGGIVLAHSLLDAMSRVVSMHYILVSIEQPFLSLPRIAETVAAGLLAILAGAWMPARDAASIQPVEALRHTRLFENKETHARRWFLWGAAAVALAAWISFQSLKTGPAWLSFAACLFLVVGFSLVMPQLGLAVGRLVLKCAPQRVLVHIGTVDFMRSLGRTAVTGAALMAAIAMMIGVSVMISSFRDTLHRWIDRTIVADIYMAPAANEIVRFEAFMPERIRQELLQDPRVKAIDRFRDFTVATGDGASLNMSVIDGSNRRNLGFVGGNDQRKMADFFRADQLVVSEILATRLKLQAGAQIALRTPGGVINFTVAGIYYDYSDSQGRLMMTRETFEVYWDDDRFHSLAIFVQPTVTETELAEMVKDVRETFSRDGEFSIYSNRSLRDRAVEIFDQTFAITHVLRLIAIIVAVLGIVLSLTTLVMERSREIALYRGIGASRGQVVGLFLGEAGLVGVCSCIAGIACGVLLSMILTWVVNKAFFGWTISFQIPIGELVWTPFWVIPVAVLAALWPAWRAGKLNLSTALRE
jgi:putative ABC transport system permease protein